MTARLCLAFGVAVAAAVSAREALPRQDANRGQQPPSFRSGVTAVPIDVRVIGEEGRPITNLRKVDFTILEDGIRQEIAFFLPQILVAAAKTPRYVKVIVYDYDADRVGSALVKLAR